MDDKALEQWANQRGATISGEVAYLDGCVIRTASKKHIGGYDLLMDAGYTRVKLTTEPITLEAVGQIIDALKCQPKTAGVEMLELVNHSTFGTASIPISPVHLVIGPSAKHNIELAQQIASKFTRYESYWRYPERRLWVKDIEKKINRIRELAPREGSVILSESPFVWSLFKPEEVTYVRYGEETPKEKRRLWPMQDVPGIEERLGTEFYLGELIYNLTEEELFGDNLKRNDSSVGIPTIGGKGNG